MFFPDVIRRSIGLYGAESILSHPKEWFSKYALEEKIIERICNYLNFNMPTTYKKYFDNSDGIISKIILCEDPNSNNIELTYYIYISYYSHATNSINLKILISLKEYEIFVKL